jgi:small subunit ribosomal protein S6
MADKAESKIYELGYHLNPDIEEAEVKTQAQELSNLITQSEGSILSSKEPRRTHLSYPIRRKQYGYFGTFDFTASPDTIEKINAQMKLQSGVLRFLLAKRSHSGKEMRVLGEHRAERMKTRPQETSVRKRTESALPEREEKAKEKIKTEEIEKEIEEVIKGL